MSGIPDDDGLETELISEIQENPDLYTPEFVKNNDLLRFACMSGFLEMAKFLTEHYELTMDAARGMVVSDSSDTPELSGAPELSGTAEAPTLNALYLACCAGHLPVAQWLVTEFEFTIGDVEYNNYAIFETVCKEGHLTVAQWLVEYFHISPEVDMTDIFIITCRHGKHDVAIWLVEYFGPTDEYISTHSLASSAAIQWTCFNGYIEILQWLVDRYKYTSENIRANDSIILRISYQAKQRAIIKWLMERFNISYEELCAAVRDDACGSALPAKVDDIEIIMDI